MVQGLTDSVLDTGRKARGVEMAVWTGRECVSHPTYVSFFKNLMNAVTASRVQRAI